ncbi:MAG: hypothetical protein Q8942_05725 [Bacillota bacterium]|nr:hypothetical protein [Bacillota bacterium]
MQDLTLKKNIILEDITSKLEHIQKSLDNLISEVISGLITAENEIKINNDSDCNEKRDEIIQHLKDCKNREIEISDKLKDVFTIFNKLNEIDTKLYNELREISKRQKSVKD